PPTPRPATPPPTPAPGAGSGWLLSVDTGEQVAVTGPVLVGRQPEARPGEAVRHLVALRSADLSLSKTHAELRLDATGGLVVLDRGSSNGSVLLRRGAARELAPGRPTTLLAGDVLRLGDREVRISHATTTEPTAR
ncbi:FHA domain-containing protein, partial [Nocardioides sp.]|uniref:FHA domain-containing protein n=1 Tax=Nocardioides sp. TaxID=35761 RepID=UPI002EDA2216